MIGGVFADYWPILHTRNSEITALRNLSEECKKIIFPVLVVRPWPNTNSMESLWAKIEEAFGDRPFALDLDKSRLFYPAKQKSQIEFDNLFSPEGVFNNYYKLFDRLTSALPVLRLEFGLSSLIYQIERAEKLGRRSILRIKREMEVDYKDVLNVVNNYIGDQLSVLVDGGWAKDILQIEAWCVDVLSHLAALRPDCEVVVSCSTFPDSFSKINGNGQIPIQERLMFSRLEGKFNSLRLNYGDWGSARADFKGMARSTARIDFPYLDQWHVFRVKKNKSYVKVANLAMDSGLFPVELNCWGMEMVAATAAGQEGSIKSAQMATAARINAHITRQAYRGAAYIPAAQPVPFRDI